MAGRHVLMGLVFLFGSWMIRCGESLSPEPAFVSHPLLDSGIDAEAPVISAACQAACENLMKMGCPESLSTGRTCGSVCQISNDLKFDTRPWCVAMAGNPEGVRACCPPGERCARIKCLGR